MWVRAGWFYGFLGDLLMPHNHVHFCGFLPNTNEQPPDVTRGFWALVIGQFGIFLGFSRAHCPLGFDERIIVGLAQLPSCCLLPAARALGDLHLYLPGQRRIRGRFLFDFEGAVSERKKEKHREYAKGVLDEHHVGRIGF